MKALVVDDDHVLADVITFTLRREGFQVTLAFDGETALLRWQEEQPDLVILAVNLPRLDGFSVCQYIREQADIPILFLTVRDDEEDIVHGLELGADDYITKPFSPRQLVARTHAVLRRASKTALPILHQVGDLVFDSSRREMSCGEGKPISLTPLESRLLDYLMLNVSQVVTADTIIEHVWGPEGGDRDMLRQLMHRLRGKLAQAQGAAGDDTELSCFIHIETVPALGYSLSLPPT